MGNRNAPTHPQENGPVSIETSWLGEVVRESTLILKRERRREEKDKETKMYTVARGRSRRERQTGKGEERSCRRREKRATTHKRELLDQGKVEGKTPVEVSLTSGT